MLLVAAGRALSVPVRDGVCSPLPSLAFWVFFSLFYLIFLSPVITAGVVRLRGRSYTKCSPEEVSAC